MSLSFSRIVAANFFNLFFTNLTDKIKSVVFFGPHEEPDYETKLFNKNDVSIKSIGINLNNDIHFNIENDYLLDPDSFDLVIISNVFEHVWNLNNFFEHIARLVKPGKFLYITGPINNFFHESPLFYCSGYDNSFFENNLFKYNFTKKSEIRIGTKRLNFMQNVMKTWPSQRAHNFPLFFSFDEVRYPLRIYLYFKNLIYIFLATAISPKLTNDRRFQTEMAIVFQKNIDV